MNRLKGIKSILSRAWIKIKAVPESTGNENISDLIYIYRSWITTSPATGNTFHLFYPNGVACRVLLHDEHIQIAYCGKANACKTCSTTKSTYGIKVT